jgi:hypothetical protein
MMTLKKAAILQDLFREVHGLITLLVVPEKFKKPDWVNKDFPIEDPYVIAGHFRHSSFFVPEKSDTGPNGVYSVVIEHKEIPVQWIADNIVGPAFTITDENSIPRAITKTFEEANKLYVERWPPKRVHDMRDRSTWPRILNPKGEFMKPSGRMAGLDGLEYPWFA